MTDLTDKGDADLPLQSSSGAAATVVTFEDGAVILHTRMNTALFAKTGSSKRLLTEGLLATKEDAPAGSSWEYSSWQFSGTFSESASEKDSSSETVCLRGALPPELLPKTPGSAPMTLHSALNGGHALDAAKAYCDATAEYYATPDVPQTGGDATSAPTKRDIIGIDIESLGAGGIIISPDFNALLFLPKDLYISSVSRCSMEQIADEQGCYVNRAMFDEKSIRFTQGVVIYKALTKSFPFNAVNEEKRQNDIRDTNYLPLKFAYPGVSNRLNLFIQDAFRPDRSDANQDVSTTGKGKSAGKVKKQTKPKPRAMLNTGDLFETNSGIIVTQKALASFVKRQDRRVRFVRWVRHNSVLLTIASVVCVIVLGIGLSIYSSSQQAQVTVGLNYIETVQMFYSGQNLLDSSTVQNSVTRDLRGISDRIASIYVTGRAGTAYESQADYLPPIIWFCRGSSSYNIYGFSQFEIDGEEKSVFFNGPRKRDRPEPLTEEEGVPLNAGDQRKVTVSYYNWFSGGNVLYIARIVEEVTLEYQSDRWLVSEVVEMENHSEELNLTVFRADYQSAFTDNTPEGLLSCLNTMREKYDFLPTMSELTEGLSQDAPSF